jgi:hypothetical protein
MADVPMFADLGNRQCRRCEAIKPLQDFPATLRTNGKYGFRLED